MVKQFRGVVKVADVQEEFDNITDRINTMVKAYNNSLKEQGEIDYYTGSSALAPSGYTLTVGGLKTIINAYDGACIGCKAYRVSDTQTKVTGGILFDDGKVYKINERLLTGTGDTLYYDKTYKRLTLGASSGTTTTWSSFTIPNFTSSNTYGSVYANYNSGNAYQARSSAGSWSWGWDMGTPAAMGSNKVINNENVRCWSWDFPSGCQVTSGASFSFWIDFARYQQRDETFLITWVQINGGTPIQMDSPTYGEHVGNGMRFTINLTAGTLTSLKIYVGFVYNSHLTLNSYQMKLINVILSGVQRKVTTITGESTGKLVKICNLNWARDDKYMNDINNTQLTGFSTYKYKMSQANYGNSLRQGIQNAESFNNTSQGNFYIAAVPPKFPWDSGTVTLLGQTVSTSGDIGDRKFNSNFMFSPLYVPKGLAVPYSSATASKARTATKVLKS